MKLFRSTHIVGAAGILVMAALSAHSARAAFILPDWTRGTANSTYQGWDIFATPAGPNAPNSPTPAVVDAAPFNPYGTANVTENTGASFITSGGNIYSPTAPISITLTIPNAGLGAAFQTDVLFQVRSQGNEFDFSTLQVNGQPASTLPDYSLTEMDREALGGFGGALVDTALRFTVPGNQSLYTLSLTAGDVSTSFDRASVDTVAVPLPAPEPASLAVLTCGAAGLLLRRRKARVS